VSQAVVRIKVQGHNVTERPRPHQSQKIPASLKASGNPKNSEVIESVAMRRELKIIEREEYFGWGCSQCGWEFKPIGPPRGLNLEAMVDKLRLRRDQEFASHVCAQHPQKSK
jgi:hypothetical protein